MSYTLNKNPTYEVLSILIIVYVARQFSSLFSSNFSPVLLYSFRKPL